MQKTFRKSYFYQCQLGSKQEDIIFDKENPRLGIKYSNYYDKWEKEKDDPVIVNRSAIDTRKTVEIIVVFRVSYQDIQPTGTSSGNLLQ